MTFPHHIFAARSSAERRCRSHSACRKSGSIFDSFILARTRAPKCSGSVYCARQFTHRDSCHFPSHAGTEVALLSDRKSISKQFRSLHSSPTGRSMYHIDRSSATLCSTTRNSRRNETVNTIAETVATSTGSSFSLNKQFDRTTGQISCELEIATRRRR